MLRRAALLVSMVIAPILRRIVPLGLVLAVAVVASPALAHDRPTSVVSEELESVDEVTNEVDTSAVDQDASHEGDMHSDNMALVASLDTGHGGDIAFWGDTAVISHGSGDGDAYNDGFVVVDISDPTAPRELGSFTCVASGADIGIWGDLVFLSVDEPFLEDGSCDAGFAAADPRSSTSEEVEAFAGVRIVSIEDPSHPRKVVDVNTCPGITPFFCQASHTHTIIPDTDHVDADGKKAPRLVVYTNYGDIIEVPLRHPEQARLVEMPSVSRGRPYGRVGCHDIGVFLPRDIAACAGSDHLALWDISDPVAPTLIQEWEDPLVDSGHSAAFSWDGETLVIGDENLPNYDLDRCPGGTPSTESALSFYDISDLEAPVRVGYYQLPRNPGTGYCSAHQFNVVPLASGRDVLVSSWYLGGTTVVDFTDPTNPFEIGHYIVQPGDVDDRPNPDRSNPWASYWYDGYIYASNMHIYTPPAVVTSERGLDVFTIEDPVFEDVIRMGRFNAGTQECLAAPRGTSFDRFATCDVDPHGLLP